MANFKLALLVIALALPATVYSRYMVRSVRQAEATEKPLDKISTAPESEASKQEQVLASSTTPESLIPKGGSQEPLASSPAQPLKVESQPEAAAEIVKVEGQATTPQVPSAKSDDAVPAEAGAVVAEASSSVPVQQPTSAAPEVPAQPSEGSSTPKIVLPESSTESKAQ